MARPRRPTRLKVIDGTMNPSRINHDEPDVHPPKIPAPPPELTATEKAVWERYAEVLEPMKIVTEADFMLFQSLVTSSAQELELEAAIRDLHGEFSYETQSPRGGGLMRRPHPEYAMLREVKREVAMLCTKFGLSPADRSRVSMDRSTDGKKTKEAEFGRRRA